MESISGLKQAVADHLTGSGSLGEARIFCEYPAAEREYPLARPVIAVGIDSVELAPAGLGGYLGRGEDTSLYGGSALITLRLDILCPATLAGESCHRLYELLCDRLMLRENPFGLRKLSVGEIAWDKAACANRLTVRGTLQAALTSRDDSAAISRIRVERKKATQEEIQWV